MTSGREYPPKHVVSLVPSITETLFDLGAGDAVVGITDFCTFPPDLNLPRVGGTKNPRVDDIRELRPDLVHMNLEENLEKHAREIGQFTKIFLTEPKSVRDVIGVLAMLGEIHDCRGRASDVASEIEAELRKMPKREFTFAVAIWKKPWMWCGGDTYVSDLVECAGGRNVLRDEKRYPTRDPETIDADILFLPDEPYAFTAEDAKQFRTRVVGPFPGHLFTWHGSRTVLGLRFLRDLVERNSIPPLS